MFGAAMKIKISGLGDGEHKYDFKCSASEIGLDSEFEKEVIVDVTLRKSIRQYYLDIECMTQKKSTCDRCLADFDLRIDCSFKLVYTYDQSFSLPDFDEIKFLNFHDTEFEIGEDVRQMIMLNIPLKLLCSEECKGLCLICGKNLNESECNCNRDNFNPKFDELKKLKF
jgi:uncharacterized protein